MRPAALQSRWIVALLASLVPAARADEPTGAYCSFHGGGHMVSEADPVSMLSREGGRYFFKFWYGSHGVELPELLNIPKTEVLLNAEQPVYGEFQFTTVEGAFTFIVRSTDVLKTDPFSGLPTPVPHVSYRWIRNATATLPRKEILNVVYEVPPEGQPHPTGLILHFRPICYIWWDNRPPGFMDFGVVPLFNPDPVAPKRLYK
jgi:hypothetical protein